MVFVAPQQANWEVMGQVGRSRGSGWREDGPQQLDVKSLGMWSAEEEEVYQDDVIFEQEVRRQPAVGWTDAD